MRRGFRRERKIFLGPVVDRKLRVPKSFVYLTMVNRGLEGWIRPFSLFFSFSFSFFFFCGDLNTLWNGGKGFIIRNRSTAASLSKLLPFISCISLLVAPPPWHSYANASQRGCPCPLVTVPTPFRASLCLVNDAPSKFTFVPRIEHRWTR